MICPYNRKTETSVVQWTEEPPNADDMKSGQTITTTTFTMLKCERENCGAWQGGRCRYAAVSLENE